MFYTRSLIRLAVWSKRHQIHRRLPRNPDVAIPVLLNLPSNSGGTGANYFAANDRRSNVAMFFPKQAWLGHLVGLDVEPGAAQHLLILGHDRLGKVRPNFPVAYG